MYKKVALRYMMAARPIEVNKGQAKVYAEKAYDSMLEVLEKHKPAPKFQDVGLQYTTSYDAIVRSTRHIAMVRVVQIGTSGKRLQVPLTITFKQAPKSWQVRTFIAGGLVQNRGYYGDVRLAPYGIKIHVNMANSYEELTSPQNRNAIIQEIYSVLIHELTHARDWYPARERNEDLTQGVFYHNDPNEVRAFMQQISDEVISYPTKNFDNPEEFFHKALEYSVTWERIKRDLTTSNKKLIMKGVWTALQDAIRSGQVDLPLVLKTWKNPRDLVGWIVQSRKNGKLNPKSKLYHWTINEPTLMDKFREQANEGELADSLFWGDYGFIYNISYQARERLENLINSGRP